MMCSHMLSLAERIIVSELVSVIAGWHRATAPSHPGQLSLTISTAPLIARLLKPVHMLCRSSLIPSLHCQLFFACWKKKAGSGDWVRG